MKRIILTAILVTELAAAGSVFADSMILDSDAAVTLALENNPDFRISTVSLETAERENRNAWNVFLPDITATAGLDGMPLESADAWDFSTALNMNLSLKSGLAYEIRSLGLDYENEKISWDEARISLIATVEKEFNSLLAEEKNIAIEAENLRLAEERSNQVNSEYEAGLATELELLQSQVTVANLRPTYLKTVADYQAGLREFLIVIGLDPEQEVSLEGSLEIRQVDLDAAELISTYLSNRSDIQAQQNAIETEKNKKAQTVADTWTPTLGISAGWSAGYSFASDAWASSNLTDGLSLGVSLSIPLDSLIPGSSYDLDIKATNDKIEQESITLAKLTAEARTEIINLVAALKTSAANVELAELNTQLAQRSYELTEQSYQQGISQRLDVEEAQQGWLEAQQQDLESRSDYLAALIDLRTALGLDSLDGVF